LAVFSFSFFQKRKRGCSKGQIMDLSSWVFWVVLVIGVIIVVGFYLKSRKREKSEVPTSEEPPQV